MTEAEETQALTEQLTDPLAPGLTWQQLRVASWLAVPEPLREPKSLTALAADMDADRHAVARWSRSSEVLEAVAKLRDAWLKGGTVSDVLGHMASQAGMRDAAAVSAAKLVLEAAGLLHSTEQQGTTTVQIAFVQQNAAPNPLRRQSDASPDALRGGAYNGDEAPAEGVGGSDREPTK